MYSSKVNSKSMSPKLGAALAKSSFLFLEEHFQNGWFSNLDKYCLTLDLGSIPERFFFQKSTGIKNIKEGT